MTSRRTTLLVALAALLVAAAPAPADAASSSFRNPVMPAAANGDDSPDPWIFLRDGSYWLTYTARSRIVVRRADTLAGLASAHPTQIWPRPGATEPESRCCEVWAPEIHRVRGPDGPRWYVYYSAKGTEPGADFHRMYVLESAGRDPAGPYHFKAQLITPHQFSIDATVATIRGRQYLAYSGGNSFQPTSLYLAPLSDPWTVAAAPIAISSPTLPWETIPFGVNEGPEFLPHGNELNIIYSASWCGTEAYSLGRLTVPLDSDLTDPATWVGAKNPEPVFSKAPDRGVYSTGHGSFFTSPDGRESWMVYHATDANNGCFTGGLRTTRAQPFEWNRGGTPRFGKPVPLDRDIAAPAGDGTLAVQVEDAVGDREDPAVATVADRRLVGYEGASLPGGRLPALRVRVPRPGVYEIHVRLLATPDSGTLTLLRRDRRPRSRDAVRSMVRPVELDFGRIGLKRGSQTIRMKAAHGLTLDELRLEPR